MIFKNPKFRNLNQVWYYLDHKTRRVILMDQCNPDKEDINSTSSWDRFYVDRFQSKYISNYAIEKRRIIRNT